MSETVLTTQLEAVNIMLSAIGEAAVSALPATARAAVVATSVLEEVQKEVLTEGWHFNTETKVALVPDGGTGLVTVSTDIISVDDSAGYESTQRDLTLRGSTLYNRVGNTSVFAGTLTVDITRLLAFTSIPQACRNYIVKKASRVFYDRMNDGDGRNTALIRDEMEARRRALADDTRGADYNIFNNPDVARIVRRRSPLDTMS